MLLYVIISEIKIDSTMPMLSRTIKTTKNIALEYVDNTFSVFICISSYTSVMFRR